MPARRRLRTFTAAALLFVLVVGVPVLLVAVAGWPLPRRLPDWQRVRNGVQQGDIPAEVVINTLAVVVWIAWAQLVWALGWELAVNLPRTQDGKPAREAPLVPAPVGSGVARLVAILFSASLATAPPTAPALAQPPPVYAQAFEAPPVDAVPPPVVSTATQAAPTRWHVAAGDNLWDIADVALGDGARAPEILELNPNLRSARDLQPGQLLRLPEGATIPADREPEPQPASSTARPAEASGYLAEAVITIEVGDTLWDLSEARLLAAYGEPAAPPATLSHVHQVIRLNPDTIEDPDLIYPGEQFRFPAIGTPPPPPPSAPAEPPPPPAARAEPSEPPPDTPRTTTPRAEAATTGSKAPKTSETAPPSVPARQAPSIPDASDVAAHPSGDSPAPWLAGLAGATVLASGVVVMHRRARNRVATAGAANLRTDGDSRQDRRVERALVAVSDLPLVRWANHELAALARRLDARRVKAAPIAVEISQAHGIELLWDTPMPTAPSPWEATDGAWAWRILYDPDLHLAGAPEPAVIPGLVTIGQRDGNSVLVDLEAFGSLAITGDPTAADNLARSIIVELASGEDLANSYVHTAGIDLDGMPQLDRAQARDGVGALDLLQSVSADHDALLQRQRLDTTFQLRLAGSAIGRELTVVIAREHVDQIDLMIEAAPPHRGVALVILGDAAGARATLDVDPTGHAVLQPLGLALTVSQLPAAAATEIAGLLRHAAETRPQEEAADDGTGSPEPDGGEQPVHGPSRPTVEPLDLGATDDASDQAPTPRVIVRTLGVPSVDGHPSLGRIELNLVTYLACAGGQATESQVIDAVWNGRAIERGTLWNRISKARAALGGFIPPRDQRSNVVRLAPDVVTDAHLLRCALDHARQLSAAQAVDHLCQAINLITGVPFDAAGYDWAHEQQHYADACELIERTVLTLVDLALDLDDVATAKEAVSLGLKALRVNEPLYRARMRIEAHCGNSAGVRQAYNELASLLVELDDAYTPTNATTTLLEELLHEHRRTA